MLKIMKIHIFGCWSVFSVITSLLKYLFPPGIVLEPYLSGRKKIKKSLQESRIWPEIIDLNKKWRIISGFHTRHVGNQWISSKITDFRRS